MALERANLIDSALANYLDEQPMNAQEIQFSNPLQEVVIFKCPKCGSNMTLKDRKQGTGKYIGCMGFPTCNNAIWFPQTVESVEVLNEICSNVSAIKNTTLPTKEFVTDKYIIFPVLRKYA